MFGHSPIESDKDKRVKIYVDGAAISASTAQSEYSRFPNFIGDRFTVTSNTVSDVKTYDIALKYADKIIPYEAGVAKGVTPGYLNFDGDHFDVSSLASNMYTVTSTGRMIPYEAGVAKGATLGFLNFDGNHFDVSSIASNQYTVTSTGWVKVNALTVKPLNIVNATNNEAVTVAEGASTIDLTFNNDETHVYNNGTIKTAAPRALNFDTGFTVTDDVGNDRVTIALASSGSSGGVIPAPYGLVRGGQYDLNGSFGDGLFNTPYASADGTVSGINDSTHGHARRYTLGGSDNNVISGILDFPVTRLAFNPHLYGKMRLSTLDDSRFFLGWNSSEVPTGDNVYLANKSGFGISYQYDTAETEDTNWQVNRNDGDATEDKVSLGQALSNTAPFTFELVGDSAGGRWGWNYNGGSFTYYTTEIPASATDLRFTFQFEEISSPAAVLDIWYLYWTQDK